MSTASRHVNPSTNGLLLELARARNDKLANENKMLRQELATVRNMLDDALALAALNQEAAAASAAKAKSAIAAASVVVPPAPTAHRAPANSRGSASARGALASGKAVTSARHVSGGCGIGRGPATHSQASHGPSSSLAPDARVAWPPAAAGRAAPSAGRATSHPPPAGIATASASARLAGSRGVGSSGAAGRADVVDAAELERRRLNERAAREAIAARQAQMAMAVVRMQAGARGFNARFGIKRYLAEEAAATRLQAQYRGNAGRGIAERRRFVDEPVARRRLVHRLY